MVLEAFLGVLSDLGVPLDAVDPLAGVLGLLVGRTSRGGRIRELSDLEAKRCKYSDTYRRFKTRRE